VAFRSHLGRYLAVDQFGNVTCDAEEKDDAAKFEISVADDSSGRWALRNDVRGYYLGAAADKLVCEAKVCMCFGWPFTFSRFYSQSPTLDL
jgi:fascin 1/2